MKTNFTLLLLLITFTISSQTDNETKGFDYGQIEDNVYSNTFFNFNLTIPDEWIVQTQEQTKNLIKAGTDVLAKDDDDFKKIIKAAEINTAYLLTVFKYEIGSPVDYNLGIIVIAENLKLAPGIKNGSDYLYHARKLLQQTQLKYNNIDSEFKKVNIDKQDFYRMNLVLNHLGKAIKQNYYSTIINKFSVSVVLSYETDEQRSELENVLNTLKFNK